MLQRLRAVLKRRGIAGSAIMFADRLTRPFGLSLISFTSLGALAPPETANNARSRFEGIASGNLWGSAESLSGIGSEVERTSDYRRLLIELVTDRGFKTIFDAPCGDMNWMPLALEAMPVSYIGGDISPSLIELNRRRFPKLSFVEFDITKDPFPPADVWHCRDCLFHLSYRDIELALRNFAASNVPYALITNHRGLIRNADIESGGWRYLDLLAAPFRLPPPEAELKDYRFGDLPRFVGLWSRERILKALSARL
ncbi:class I SAM-dependent methyltransferase [Sphingomonas daechungensis]|uniref:class I SAM-dependent methyltransferase n=1 Tax=Sphingomonas daechungensis TaxID=1176646 RepID=UPI0037849B6A